MLLTLLLILSAFLFSIQFLLAKTYQKRNGAGIKATLKLSVMVYLTGTLFFYLKYAFTTGNFSIRFSFFTLIINIATSVAALLGMYCGNKALSVGNMSVYAVFTMLGNIILPSVVGMVFFGEKVTFLKIFCMLLMIAAIVIINLKKESDAKKNKKAIFFYVAIFILNGLSGILFTVHQNNPTLTACYDYVNGVAVANSDVFVLWNSIVETIAAIILLTVYCLFFDKNKADTTVLNNSEETIAAESKIDGRTFSILFLLIIGVSYGIVHGLGNYFIAIGTGPDSLGASVTFPLVNGGTILFSTLFGCLFYKEKLSLNSIIGLILVIASTILFMVA